MAEVVKLVTCLFLVFAEEGKSLTRWKDALHSTIVKQPMDTLKVCVPSLVYIIQNNLLYVSASHLDAATYQVRDAVLLRDMYILRHVNRLGVENASTKYMPIHNIDVEIRLTEL